MAGAVSCCGYCQPGICQQELLSSIRSRHATVVVTWNSAWWLWAVATPVILASSTYRVSPRVAITPLRAAIMPPTLNTVHNITITRTSGCYCRLFHYYIYRMNMNIGRIAAYSSSYSRAYRDYHTPVLYARRHALVQNTHMAYNKKEIKCQLPAPYVPYHHTAAETPD